MLGLFKKKKQESLPDLPPPPSPPGMGMPAPMGDIPPIVPSEELAHEEPMPTSEELSLPEPPSFAPSKDPFAGVDFPEAPAPEMPEAPVPKLPEEMAPITPPMEELHEEFEPITPKPAEEVAVFDRTVRERVRRPVAQAFVSVDEYSKIMEHSNRVREKLSEAEDFVHRLDEIKAEEEKAFDKWRAQLEDVERKLEHIDRVIAKAKR
jgi:hypothetical protein